MAEDTDDLMFGVKQHWNIFQNKEYTMAVCFFGGKTIIASVSKDVQTVQIIGPNEDAYVLQVDGDEVVGQYFKDNVPVDKVSTDLKVYKGILHTLPETIKDALGPIM
jgi:hypothetical protein